MTENPSSEIGKDGDALSEKEFHLPVGVVVRRQPGVTRWARWSWRAVAVLPGAGPADWAELRREDETVDYHAGTLTMSLYRTDTEAYLAALAADPPKIYVVMEKDGAEALKLKLVTASAYEAQDYLDSGEEIVEPVPMPPGLVALVREFCERHHRDEKFIKRRRDKAFSPKEEDGKGDERVRQIADVYRAPKRRMQ